MSSSTTWRSPLSILMGARRNDDADLELREDYFHPQRSPAAPSSAPPKSAPAEQTPSRSGLASYVPFSYFGLTSPAPARTEVGQNGTPTNNGSHHVDAQQNGPPRLAFPPPISESPEGRKVSSHVSEGEYLDERGRQGSDPQISHPWFNRLALTDPDNESNHSNGDERRELFAAPNGSAGKPCITWEDKKAIIGTTFNFTNSIIGAGAMGLGGAFAASGGGISVILLVGFAILTKLSLDLVVDLSSDPAIIRKARAKDDGRGIEIIDFYESSSSESDNNMLGESESQEPSAHDNPFADILDAIEESKNPQNSQPGQSNGPAVDENAVNTNAEATAGASPQNADSNNNASPLMADEEEEEQNVEVADALQTPAKASGANVDHPLASQEPLLTMDVTAPRHFSPLNLNTDNLPAANKMAMPHTVQSDNRIQQTSDLTSSPCTYEELGRAAFGTAGRMSVLLSKALYSFGCLVAYVVVVRDNFGLALRRMINGSTPYSSADSGNGNSWLNDDDFLAFWVSALFMLPLSCPRTMKPLAKFSFVSILSIVFLILVVVYLYFTCTNPEGGPEKSSFYENWIEIRSFSGLVESLGCFVFTFVCHHTVNLAYESLPAPIRNPRVWRRVSTNSIALAAEASLAIGIFAYLTFGSQTPADVLTGYPADITLANVARLLLCLTMVLTFPLPFLTCREMSILICLDAHNFCYRNGLDQFNFFGPLSSCISGAKAGASSLWDCIRGEQRQNGQQMLDAEAEEEPEADVVHMQLPSFFKRWGRDQPWDNMHANEQLTQALLSEDEPQAAVFTSIGGQRGKEINPSPLSSQSGDESSSETTISTVIVPAPRWLLDDGRQLTLPWHAALTFTLWMSITICAIKSPSLGDVLDLVGAFSGTVMAFVLPAIFSFKLKGHSRLSMTILSIGGTVGLLGTIFSFGKFVHDATEEG